MATPPKFRAGRLSSICPMTPFSISTRKWRKTATLGREGGAKNRRSCMISSNQVFCKNHRALSSAPGGLSAPAWPGRPCSLHSHDHSPAVALLAGAQHTIHLFPGIASLCSTFPTAEAVIQVRTHHLTFRFLVSSLVGLSRLKSGHSHPFCTKLTGKRGLLVIFELQKKQVQQ